MSLFLFVPYFTIFFQMKLLIKKENFFFFFWTVWHAVHILMFIYVYIFKYLFYSVRSIKFQFSDSLLFRILPLPLPPKIFLFFISNWTTYKFWVDRAFLLSENSVLLVWNNIYWIKNIRCWILMNFVPSHIMKWKMKKKITEQICCIQNEIPAWSLKWRIKSLLRTQTRVNLTLRNRIISHKLFVYIETLIKSHFEVMKYVSKKRDKQSGVDLESAKWGENYHHQLIHGFLEFIKYMIFCVQIRFNGLFPRYFHR